VLLTGHTGFKGTWLSLWLEQLGATTIGLALHPDTDPSIFNLTRPHPRLVSRIGDIRDPSAVSEAVAFARPTIVIHMAAQPLVRYSYREPIKTIATNVMGTANVLQSLRNIDGLRAVLVITTDKVYANSDAGRPFGEQDRLGGYDPYSASKAAAEIVSACFAKSFFGGDGAPVATGRAGNVLGGGDWAEDRLIPDIWRAQAAGVPVTLRNPKATRPWQHVLDLLSGYLIYVEKLASGTAGVPRVLNFGPPQDDTLTVMEVTVAVLAGLGSSVDWHLAQGAQPKEMQLLSLDASLARKTLGWQPRLSGREALSWAVEWYTAFKKGADPRVLCVDQITRYETFA
jgi:CDP-glucose 4,6-dehydratase